MHRNRYSERLRVALDTGSESRTKGSFKAECDVNNILERYQRTGVITHVRNSPGAFGDFSRVGDYQSALNQVLKAQDAFMTLPAEVRDRFKNDPGRFIEFVEDPKNGQELVKLGLAVPSKHSKEAKASVEDSGIKGSKKGAKAEKAEDAKSD